MITPVLEGERIVLVPFSEDHLNSDAYLGWLQDYEVVKYINRKEYLLPVSFSQVEKYVKSIMDSEKEHILAIVVKDNEKFIGTFKFGNINWDCKTVNLGVLIGERDYWGKGIASEAFSLALEFSFNKLGIRKVIAGCVEPNIGMRKVLMSLGFTQEACLRKHDFIEGNYVDHYNYGIFKEEFMEKKNVE